MIDGSEKRNRQLAFELQNSHVCEKRSNMSHRKRVRTLESFFARNRSQSESEKNDTEEEQCIDQEETDEDRRKPKKSPTFLKTWLRDHTWLRYEKEAMFCYFCRKSWKTKTFASAEGVQILEPQLCSNSFLQPLMFGREPTEELVHVRLSVIEKGIQVYKGCQDEILL